MWVIFWLIWTNSKSHHISLQGCVSHFSPRNIETRSSKLQSAYGPYVVRYRMPDNGRKLRSAFWPPASARQGYHKLDRSTLPSPMTPFYSLCIIIAGCIKECKYLYGGKSYFCVQTLTPILGIETLLINTITSFCLLHVSEFKNYFWCPVDLYIWFKTRLIDDNLL